MGNLLTKLSFTSGGRVGLGAALLFALVKLYGYVWKRQRKSPPQLVHTATKPPSTTPVTGASGEEINHGLQPMYPHTQTIVDLLQQHAKNIPHSSALVVPEGEHTDGHRLTISYSEMHTMVVRAAHNLLDAVAAAPHHSRNNDASFPAHRGNQLWPAPRELTRALDPDHTSNHWVILVLPQGLAQVVAVWAVLFACKGYVPVDSETKLPRLRRLFAETKPVACIGEVHATPIAEAAAEFGVPLLTFAKGVRAGLVQSGSPLGAPSVGSTIPKSGVELRRPKVDELCILLYSSGSTGTPKGIVYDHRWLMGGSWFVAQDLELTRASRCLLRCSYVWSVSVYDLFPANMVGATLFIPPRGGHMNVQYISETIAKETIHAVVMQPTLLTLLLDEHNASHEYPLRSLRHVISSGEKLHSSVADAFVRTEGLNAKLWNMYGATEAGCTYFAVSSGEADRLAVFPEGVPAGVPQCYIDVWIMSRARDGASDPDTGGLTPVPTGQMGEICFGGGGHGFMAVGYWNQPAMTAEKFIHTRRYGRIYRTGDAGRWQDGQVVVKGRLDRQVKVRGVRIQPEEIEARLKRFLRPDGSAPIKACMVVPSAREPIELTAFFETAAEDNAVDIAAVRLHLLQELGRVYLPKHIVHLRDGMPRTASGKPEISVLKRLATEQEEGAHGLDPTSQHDMEAGRTQDMPLRTTGVSGSVILGTTLQMVGSDTHMRTWAIDLRTPPWSVVSDHKYRGEGIFPGSGYLALAVEVCKLTWSEAPAWELRDAVFTKPLPLSQPRALRVTSTAPHSGEIALRIESRSGPGKPWTLHFKCAALASHKTDTIAATATRGKPYSVPMLYAQMADCGFDYGPNFQAIQHVCIGQEDGTAFGQVAARRDSPFTLDLVEVDACFQMSPLVSPLGFRGAPTAIKRLWLSTTNISAQDYHVEDRACKTVQVIANDSDDIDFKVSYGGLVLCTIDGLALQAFDAGIAPSLHLVTWSEYQPPPAQSRMPLRLIAIGPSSRSDADALHKLLDADEVVTWTVNDDQPQVLSPMVTAIVAQDNDIQCASVEKLLPCFGHNLPHRGRVWVVAVGPDSLRWQVAGRRWAAKFPALQLSILCVSSIGSELLSSHKALLDTQPPPFLSNGMQLGLKLPNMFATRPSATQNGDVSEPRRFAGLELKDSTKVAIFSATATPLTAALLRSIGPQAVLVLPGEAVPARVDASVLCAISSVPVTEFERLCASSAQCVTICSSAGLIPTTTSTPGAADSVSALVSTASSRRARSGHASWTVFSPPLMERLWFEPAAPAGLHRCSVDSFVDALAQIIEPADTVVGVPSTVPKHWLDLVTKGLHGGEPPKVSTSDLRRFLLAQLSEILGVAAETIADDSGIEDLGVPSLDTLRLSQRIRRYLGREFSAFALQNNPTVAEIVAKLSTTDEPVAGTKGKVLCLHGYHTSSAVLRHQMLPLTHLLQDLGYELVVPDGPHKATGEAFSAEGLDKEDTYGWWLYDGDSNDSPTIGLEESLSFVRSFAPIAGVVGFSQGGGMAAQVANELGASFALLFSPVYIPGHPPQCDCRTLVVFDRKDEVMPAINKLLADLRNPQVSEHTHGHRLPPSTDTEIYRQIDAFLQNKKA